MYRFAKNDAPDGNDDCSKFKRQLHASLRKKLKERFELHKTIPYQWLIGSALDPRFKDMVYVAQNLPTPLDRSFSKVIKNTHKQIKEELQAMEQAGDHYVDFNHELVDLQYLDSEIEVEPRQPATRVEPAAKRSCISDLATIFGDRIHEEVHMQSVHVQEPDFLEQWQKFQLEPQIPLTASDPLKWWNNNKHKFPLVARLARKYLAMQASAAASERVWSLAGNVETKKRMALTPEKLDKILFIKCNM